MQKIQQIMNCTRNGKYETVIECEIPYWYSIHQSKPKKVLVSSSQGQNCEFKFQIEGVQEF